MPSPTAPDRGDAKATPTLERLRGLRTAPCLSGAERHRLRQELDRVLGPCQWFTVGVMAPAASLAVDALRSLESDRSWPPLVEAAESESQGCADGPSVFLKGNQRTGTYQLRQEDGLGEGLLISGHHPEDPSVEGTWGPFPLDFFAAGVQVDEPADA